MQIGSPTGNSCDVIVPVVAMVTACKVPVCPTPVPVPLRDWSVGGGGRDADEASADLR